MDGRRKPYSKRPPKSSTEPDESRLMKAITKLWLRTKHTSDQEANREAIFSTWFQDLSQWPIRQTEAVLHQLADDQEWWPAWSTVRAALPAPGNQIGYDSPWARIKSASVRSWAEGVARAYRDQHPQADRASLIGQATALVMRDGEGSVAVDGGPVWDGQTCLRRERAARTGQAA